MQTFYCTVLNAKHGWLFWIPQQCQHCDLSFTYSKQPPTEPFMPAWHPNNKQTNRPTSFSSPQTSVSAYDLPALLKNHPENESHCRLSVWQKAESSLLCRKKEKKCWTGPGVLSVTSQALPLTLWNRTLLHARGNLWSFYLFCILFLSHHSKLNMRIDRLKEPSLIVSGLINYPTLRQGGWAVPTQADPFHPRLCSALGGATLNGAAL